jgi:hypothetical protein
MLAARAEVLETPVRFYAMSPAQVRRTTVMDGIRALAKIVWWRFSAPSYAKEPVAAVETARAPRG